MPAINRFRVVITVSKQSAFNITHCMFSFEWSSLLVNWSASGSSNLVDVIFSVIITASEVVTIGLQLFIGCFHLSGNWIMFHHVKGIHKSFRRGVKNARIALKIFLCTPRSILYNVCKYCNDPISSFWVLRGITESVSQSETLLAN